MLATTIPLNSDQALLQEAVEALQEQDRLKAATKANESRLRALCRAYDRASGTWGFQPYHLRRACEARGLL